MDTNIPVLVDSISMLDGSKRLGVGDANTNVLIAMSVKLGARKKSLLLVAISVESISSELLMKEAVIDCCGELGDGSMSSLLDVGMGSLLDIGKGSLLDIGKGSLLDIGKGSIALSEGVSNRLIDSVSVNISEVDIPTLLVNTSVLCLTLEEIDPIALVNTLCVTGKELNSILLGSSMSVSLDIKLGEIAELLVTSGMVIDIVRKLSGADEAVRLSEESSSSLVITSEVTNRYGTLFTLLGKGTIEDVKSGIDSVINSSLLLLVWTLSSGANLLTRLGTTALLVELVIDHACTFIVSFSTNVLRMAPND